MKLPNLPAPIYKKCLNCSRIADYYCTLHGNHVCNKHRFMLHTLDMCYTEAYDHSGAELKFEAEQEKSIDRTVAVWEARIRRERLEQERILVEKDKLAIENKYLEKHLKADHAEHKRKVKEIT